MGPLEIGIGGVRATQEVMDLCAKHGIKPDIEVRREEEKREREREREEWTVGPIYGRSDGR